MAQALAVLLERREAGEAAMDQHLVERAGDGAEGGEHAVQRHRVVAQGVLAEGVPAGRHAAGGEAQGGLLDQAVGAEQRALGR
ncbi:hypothetical protein D3C78_1728630 [compost metagenome]